MLSAIFGTLSGQSCPSPPARLASVVMGSGGAERRSDARRNRDRILQAARELFGDSAAVPMYEVARRAGVGQATLYRHFPDRHALIDTISEIEFAGLAELAAQQADRPDGVVVLLGDLTERMARLRGLAEVIRTESTDGTHANRRDEIGALLGGPLATGQAAGVIRADLDLDDIFRMIHMIEGAVLGERDPTRRAVTADRAQELLIDGLRPRPPGISRRGDVETDRPSTTQPASRTARPSSVLGG